MQSLRFISKLWIVFLNKRMLAGNKEEMREQWQEEASGWESITGRKGLSPVAGDESGGLPLHKEFLCQVFWKEKP